MLLLIVIASPKYKKYPSSYLYLIIEVIILIPTLSYFWMNYKSINYMLWEVISAIVIAFILHLKRYPIHIEKEKIASTLLGLLFIFYIFISIYLIIVRGGIDPRAFSFEEIYSLRAENKITGILGYFVNWCTKAFFPFFFMYYFYKKKHIYLIIMSVLQILFYLSFGNKAFLLSLGFLLFMLFIMKMSKNIARDFIGSMTLANIAAYLLDVLNISKFLRDVLPFRLLFVPAMGQFQYYEYFIIYDKLYFSEGKIGRLLSIPYKYEYPIGVIVNQYFRGKDFFSNGNTGIFSYAFADAGIIGMIAMAIIVGLIFWTIDSTTSKLPVYITVCAMSYACVVLNDTGLLISLMTGGIMVTMILLFVFNSAIKSDNRSSILNIKDCGF